VDGGLFVFVVLGSWAVGGPVPVDGLSGYQQPILPSTTTQLQKMVQDVPSSRSLQMFQSFLSPNLGR
jgi:hypothetical protein